MFVFRNGNYRYVGLTAGQQHGASGVSNLSVKVLAVVAILEGESASHPLRHQLDANSGVECHAAGLRHTD